MLKLVEQDDSLVVPDLDAMVLTSSGDKAKPVGVSTADDVFLVCIGLAALNKIRRCLVVHLLIHVDLDNLVPSACNDCMIFTAIADKGDLTVKRVMFFQVEDGHA